MDAKHTLGEPRVLISRAALRHNAALVRQTVGPTPKICAIIKADGYGHGAALVAQTLAPTDSIDRPLVDAFAVASIDEAALLPPVGQPVLVFRPVENTFLGRQRSRIEHAIRQGWVLTVCSAAGADDVARVALACERRANVQVMIDTGMTRSGVDASEAGALLRAVQGHASLRLWGICSHFACSEETDHPANAAQFALFQQTCHDWSAAGTYEGRPPVRHMANSGAIFNHPATHLDMVRPGIALYGIDPSCRIHLDRKLRPAMKWTAPLVMVRPVKAGTSVGYGQTWTAERDTHVGLVPVGYADGYLRSFSSAAWVIVNNQPAPVVGRVSMDLITIDLGSPASARVGDEVTVLDDDPLSPASAYQLAKVGQTIPYELFCRIGARVHRVPVDEPQPATIA